MAIKSKVKIESQLQSKTNKELVDTVILAKKNPAWMEVAGLLTISRRKRKNINLTDIEKVQGKILVVPGKVLSQGDLTKKVKVVAMNFSEKAREKLKNAGCELSTIMEEIQKNKEAKEVTILK
jgi:large subunit ribosomal protein L18e